MESPNPSPYSNPSSSGKRKRSPSGERERSPGPTEAIPAPPTLTANVTANGNDHSSWKTNVIKYLGKYYGVEVVPDLFPDYGALHGCKSGTLKTYLQSFYEAKSDLDRKACKSILDSDSPEVFPKRSNLGVGKKAREGFLKAFSDKYNDDRSCLKTFTDFIDGCAAQWSATDYLAPYTSLVQSSGTGKSRLVKEFANERYVIYCCLRERGSSGIPARSWIANELVPASKDADHDRSEGFLLYASFFCACMDHLAWFVGSGGNRTQREWCAMQLEEEESGESNVSGVAFWKEIHKRMTTFQKEIHEKVTIFQMEIHEKMTIFQKEIHEKMTIFQTTVRDACGDVNDRRFQLLVSKIKSSCENLVESFGTSGLETKGKALLTFALDESKSLLGEYGGTTHFSIFRWMATFLAESCGIFIVLLDTTSKISNFMPSKIPDSSFRYTERSNRLLPAFYAVDTFNIFAPKEKIWTVLGDSPCDFTKVLPKHFMKGRPLFGSYIKSGSGAELSLRHVVQLAAEKLLGGISVEEGMERKKDPYSAVALLSVRAAVFVKPQSELASSLVAKHLGMCLAISSDRSLVFTEYPSEPVLAEAACRIMNGRSTLDLGELLGPVLTYVREGIVEGGARGELVARILFLLAWDRACKNDASTYEPRFAIFGEDKVLYTRPLVVREFLRSLADKDQFDIALIGQIDQEGMERFLNGRVFFTHFTSVTRSVKRPELIDFYERGAAILCKRNQPAVDMIIPVRLCGGDMSCILVQVRNYTHSDSRYRGASMEIRPEKAGLSVEPADYPYLVLYLQLGYINGKVYNLKYEKHNAADPGAIPSAKRGASDIKEDPFQMIVGLFSLKPAAYPCLRDSTRSTVYEADEDSENSKHLSRLCQAWSDPLCYVDSIEPTALDGSTMKQAKYDFVMHTCVLTYASSSPGS